MAKGGSTVVGILAWFTGVVVSLVVGNAMIIGLLTLPGWLGGASVAGLWIAKAIGWVVVITTVIGAVMALLKR